MVGASLTMFFNRIFNKKWTVILGVLMCALGATGPVIASLFGLMPTTYAVLAVLLVGFAFLSSYAIEPVGVTVASMMMGDMPDKHAVFHDWRSLPDNELLAVAERDGFRLRGLDLPSGRRRQEC